ncbi:hypothetical protein IJ182_01845 [bacterium]|nr:hypothetical protein [bacterium]
MIQFKKKITQYDSQSEILSAQKSAKNRPNKITFNKDDKSKNYITNKFDKNGIFLFRKPMYSN